MARKKILYIVEAMGGGVFTYIVDLANELVNEFDMYIAYATRPQTPKNYKDYFDNRIHLIEVKNFCREIRPTKEIKAIREVKEIAKEVKPDIIHFHSSKAGAIGRIAFDGNKVPLFYTPHGYSFLMKDTSKIKRFIYWCIEKLFSQKNCTTISCSFGEHQETLKLTSNAVYVNNAINVEKLGERLKNVEKIDHPFTVFTLGRICHQKNPKLFNELAMIMPETKFLWIGDGDLRNELSSPNIEISGWVDREEALRLSMNADVFILTSLWEGLPISLLEAMYMKKLCVVSDVVGNRDVIHNKDNGYVCRNVEEFKVAIEERKSKYIEKSYQDLIEKYETKIQVKQYTEIYKEKISKWQFIK